MPSSAGWAERARRAALVALACVAGCGGAPQEHRAQLAQLGTVVTLSYYGVDGEQAATATAALEAHFLQRGQDWYPWADGELARLNAAIAAGETAPASDALAALLRRAAELERRSSGRFNAGIGRLVELWGFHEPLLPDWRPPAAEAVAAIVETAPSLAQLEFDGSLVRSGNPQLAIDPGGIAKGALLAEAGELLAARGIGNAIIDLGGDLLVIGRVDARAARIGIRRPAGGTLGWLEVEPGEAVMTSGNYERFFRHAGRRYAHVLDPATGAPARGTASVTVVDRDPLLADAAATALLVGGAAEFDALAAALGVTTALLVTDDGDVRLTAAMRERVNWLEE